MPFKHFKNMAVALGLMLASASGVQAMTFDFEFSFTGSVNAGSPMVTGIVRGLSEGVNTGDTVEILTLE